MVESQVNIPLDRKIECTLKRLEQLSVKLESYKPLLDHHASCAEFEIKANFDSFVDALNQRQSVLLKQLTKVYQEKIASIDSQRQMVETIRSGINSCVSNRHASDPHVHEFISRAESIIRNSSSDPFISFRNEHSMLSQLIGTYGKVISRYGGHFADPGRPSACLPLSVEEEDDHEISHEQTTVGSRVSSSCSCVKPDLQQWLFSKSHICCSNVNHGNVSRNTWNSFPSLPGLQGEPQNHRTVSITERPHTAWNNKKPTDVHQFSSVRLPRGQCWLDSCLDENVKNSTVGCCAARKFSSTSSSGCSDFTTVGTYSDSFSILTGHSESLTDWLFCEPQQIQLCDIPGLSKNVPLITPSSYGRSEPLTTIASSEDLSFWLTPSSDGVREPHSDEKINGHNRPSLLPTHLTQSGPLDIEKWVICEKHTSDARVSVESECTLVTPDELTAVDDPLHHEVELNHNADTPDYCIYSQCHGGPGGPTCCGARIKCSKAVATRMECAPASHPDLSPCQKLLNPCSDASLDKGMINCTHPVVAQLNQITSTHWTQWLNKDSPQADGNKRSPTSCTPDDESKWLCPPSSPTCTNDRILNKASIGEDSVSPPKRRSLPTFTSDVSNTKTVHSPCVYTADHDDRCPTSVDSRDSRKLPPPTDITSKGLVPLTTACLDEIKDYEAQLIQKMHGMSTGPCS